MNGRPISGTSAGVRPAHGQRRGGPGLLALLLGALLLLVTACGGSGSGGSDEKAKQSGGKGDGPAASQAVVTVTPRDGAESVATSDALKVTADRGD